MMEEPIRPTDEGADDDREIGRRISMARARAGLTVRSLALRLGINHSTLLNYESGRRPLRVSQLIAIARALGCSPAALLIDPPESAAIVGRLDGDLELALQVQIFLDTLDMPL